MEELQSWLSLDLRCAEKAHFPCRHDAVASPMSYLYPLCPYTRWKNGFTRSLAWEENAQCLWTLLNVMLIHFSQKTTVNCAYRRRKHWIRVEQKRCDQGVFRMAQHLWGTQSCIIWSNIRNTPSFMLWCTPRPHCVAQIRPYPLSLSKIALLYSIK